MVCVSFFEFIIFLINFLSICHYYNVVVYRFVKNFAVFIGDSVKNNFNFKALINQIYTIYEVQITYGCFADNQ